MAKILSPIQLQAGSALMQNQGITLAPGLTAALYSYNNLSLINPLRTAIANGSGVLSSSTIAAMQTIASDASSCPALADSIPQAFLNPYPIGSTVDTTFAVTSPTTTDSGMSGMVGLVANGYLGNGDNAVFAQLLSASLGYIATTNLFINSAINAQTYLGDTFTNMNNLITGDLTQVNLNTQGFGSDLKNLGNAINLSTLSAYGTPLALIQQIVKQAGIVTPIVVALINAGVEENIVLTLNDPALEVTDSVQKNMYVALTYITGDDLKQILSILNVTTPNISTLADLLNPAIIFPTSYTTITAPACVGSRGVYVTIPSGSTVNMSLTSEPSITLSGFSYFRLSRIIPDTLALANRALSVSLQQITNIGKITLPQLAQAYLNVETTKDLPDISSQLTPIPADVTNYYKNTLANGTGDNGTILLVDMLGTAAGVNQVDNLADVIDLINELDSASQLTTLTDIYTRMKNVVDGTYGIPPAITIPAGPGVGVYTTYDLAISALISAAQTEISTIITNNSTRTTKLNSDFTSMGNQMALEKNLQTKALISLGNIVGNNLVSTQGLVIALPSYGLQTEQGGAAQFLESIADLSIPGGQAIVATLREGRSKAYLNHAGIGTANQISGSPQTPPPQANLIPSTYSSADAQNQIIT